MSNWTDDRPVDRWNPKLVTTTTEHPRKFVVPSGEAPTSSAVVPRGKTWGIRERGDLEGTVVHAYRCPVHGVVDVEVLRARVPDEIVCPVEFSLSRDERGVYVMGFEHRDFVCGEMATWAGSFCGQGVASGEVTC